MQDLKAEDVVAYLEALKPQQIQCGHPTNGHEENKQPNPQG
jgi:hypothetical protein